MKEDEEACSRLNTWALENGCAFHCLKVSPHPQYGGYGLFNTASTLCSEDEFTRLALRIPNSLIISIDSISEEANDSNELAEILNSLPAIPTLEPIIAIFLCYQVSLLRMGQRTKWSEYISSLPKDTCLPVTLNPQEIAFLSRCGTSISKAVPAKFSYLQQIYDTLQSEVQESWFQEITFQDYVLYDSWVSSRTIESPTTQQPLLVPLLDMANHSPLRNTAWEITPDGGIELRREPIDIMDGEEVCISYDVDRGTGERLYRYGFFEDQSESALSKCVTLFSPKEPRVQGGNILRLPLSSVVDSFRDLLFLSYENWLNILPMPSVESIEGWDAVHRVLPPTEDYHDVRIEVSPPAETGVEAKYFETPDLETLLEALNYADTFKYARIYALKAIREVVEFYREGIWRPKDGETFDEWKEKEGDDTGVRKEVWEMVRLLCIQEGRLLDEALNVLNEEIPKEM